MELRKLFKRTIPKEDVQEVTVLESYTLEWRIQGQTYLSEITQHKAFINKDDVLEYEKQLKEAAKFLGTLVKTEITVNN